MILRLIFPICSLLLLFSCANHSLEGASQPVSISYLKSLCKGSHYRIVEDISIEGVVVATDWLGELHKSVIIVDETGGLEISIDSHNISEQLPIFSETTIFCNGLALARIGSKIELGAMPTGDFPLDNIGDEMLNRYIRVGAIREDYTPATKRFSEIGVADISNIFRFEDIRICDEERGLSWCNTDENGDLVTTYRTFVDGEGNALAVCTLPTCIYAKDEIPAQKITVIGAIDYSDNRYFLRIVNKSIIE